MVRIPGTRLALALALALAAGAAQADSHKQPPFYVSLSAREAMMRAGPGKTFPATWRYIRPELPLRVVQVHADWRRVEDPDGASGWMRANLLSDERTAIIRGEVRPLRAGPDSSAKVVWRAEPGVVGKIAHCSGGWCEFDVHGRVGYVEVAHIWGVGADETID